MLKFKKYPKMRGITLMETLLSLAIGGLVIVSSVQGVVTYNENVKIQASAALLDKMRSAADLYAEDHFDQLVANAPQQLPITELDPYLGSTILRDPFRADYRLSTRTYSYQTPDPVTGGVVTQDALQVLVIAQDGNSHLADSPRVRIDIANTMGADAGFLSPVNDLCSDGAGNSMPAGTLCGAFGSYAFNTAAFPGLNADSRYAALVTKGDSSVYGDQLYRYDFGDPELNTMHTTLNMDGNDIINATRIRNVEHLEMQGARARITNLTGELSIRSSGNFFMGADTDSFVISGATPASIPRITSPAQTVQIGTGDNDLAVGDLAMDTATGPGVNNSVAIATGDLLTGNIFGDEGRLSELNSLHKETWDPLRLQNIAKGEVIIGERARYVPPRGLALGSSTYELSDGQLTTGVIKTQDVTCADCGGNLSEVLPRWRHMGTYFIPNVQNYYVPKPACGSSRRDEVFRDPIGDERRVLNSTSDARYFPRIILIPKHIIPEDQESMGGFNLELIARDEATRWDVNANSAGDMVKVEALAMTYCVFVGGPPSELNVVSPTVYNTRENMPGGGTWTVLPPN